MLNAFNVRVYAFVLQFRNHFMCMADFFFCFHVNFCLVVTYKRTPVAVRPIVNEDAKLNNNNTNESRKRKLQPNGK